MTANGTAGPAPIFLSSVATFLQRGWRLVGRLLLGGLFIVGAGVVALATALLGLLIACAALVFRFTRGGEALRRRAKASRKSGVDDFTLEARQTARGWTVE
ncbi:MAG: hypothetical protein AAF950_01870 [Pseudomonadota bacterium]